MDYDYSSYLDSSYLDTTSDYSSLAGLGVFFVIMMIVCFALVIFFCVCEWKIFKKAGRPGWYSIVPFLNTYTLFEMTWGEGWYFLMIFVSIIPAVGTLLALAVTVLTNIKLAKAFGKSTGFGIGLSFLNVVFIPILAFDSSEYIGAPVDGILNPSVMKTTTCENQTTTTYSQPTQNPVQGETPAAPTENVTFCKNCGAKLTEQDVFCPGCGSKKE